MKLYLERNDHGTITLYPLALAGCFVRANSEQAALEALPAAVAEWANDMQRHGEPLPANLDAEATIVERGISDDDVRDETFSTELFEPEKQLISQQEVDHLLRLAEHNRADLLTLLRGMDGNTLRWKPERDAPTVGELILHLGDADHWYTTRIDAGLVSAEWDTVTALPTLQFLAEERRRALANMANLTDAQRSAVFQAPHDASRPGEWWSVRKILRRMLAHEREHIAQLRDYFDMLARTC